MAEAVKKDIRKIITEGTQIDEAVKQAVKDAVLRHKNAGNSIVTMKDGQMVWLKPEEITV
jgi:isoaspartyl peptidase/L-asparaginase-like protein (Ntn-hydrolase superfamily)